MSATVTPLLRSPDPTDLNRKIDALVAALDRDGAVELPALVDEPTLTQMQEAFDSRMQFYNVGDVMGYSRGELKRRGVHDVLTLAQGFTDIGIHPLVMGVIERYVGKSYALAEAKGWQTDRTIKDPFGWHGDAWFDKSIYTDPVTMPREVKLAFYLTDVNSGAFQYFRGSHRKQIPREWPAAEAMAMPAGDLMEFKGRAGTAMLFDTSGLHRQGMPVLEPRRAVFYNYHDLDVALQKEDVDYYRYHPLILNAAFLGGLTPEQERVLGFGHKGRFRHDFVRKPHYPAMHALVTMAQAARLHASSIAKRVRGKLSRMTAKG